MNNNWSSYKNALDDIDARPWKYSESSEVNWSEDFRLVNNTVSGSYVRELEVDSESLSEDFDLNLASDDGTKLHATLSRIFEYDLFEHEGEDRYAKLIEEICCCVESGEFFCSDVSCYGEDRLVDVRITRNEMFLSHKPNNQ